MKYAIRKALPTDRDQVVSIFNSYASGSFSAYPDQPVGPEFFDKLMDCMYGDSIYVIETDKGEDVGFGLLKMYPGPDVFHHTAEVAYFITHQHTGKGLGQQMLDILVADAKKYGVETLLASISSRNEGSIRFHEQNAFRECGRFEKVGKKFGSYFDVVWMQRFI